MAGSWTSNRADPANLTGRRDHAGLVPSTLIPGGDDMTLSAYEQREWDKLQKRKAASLSKEARNILPQSARDRLASLGQKVKSAPGADKVAAAYGGAARGLSKAVGDTASRTVSKKGVVEQYRRAGHDVAGLDEVREL